MRTFSELQSDLKDMLSVNGLSSSFFSDTTSITSYIKNILNKGYEWAHGLYDWPFMERALSGMSTVAAQEYYQYPTSPFTFKTNGITRIEINGDKYEKHEINDYRDFKINYPSQTNMKIFADSQRFFFIFPYPTSTYTMDVWGIIKPDVLANDADTTMFYDGEPDGEEAILLKAYSIAMRKAGRTPEAREAIEEATAMLKNMADKFQARKNPLMIDKPMFTQVDYLRPGITGFNSNPGTFNYPY